MSVSVSVGIIAVLTALIALANVKELVVIGIIHHADLKDGKDSNVGIVENKVP